MQCTEAEVLLVALLLYDRVDEGFDLDGWAATVVAESAAFVPGAPWSAVGDRRAARDGAGEARVAAARPHACARQHRRDGGDAL